MKVFATTAIEEREPGVPTYVPTFNQLAERDRFQQHGLAATPDEADLILFLDGHQHYRDVELNAIRRHPLVQRYQEKAFIYSELDQPWCAMPGLYVAMPKTAFEPQRQRACAYLSLPNPYISASRAPVAAAKLLYSFMGRGGTRTREQLLRQGHSRAHIEDTSQTNFFGFPSEELDRRKRRYAEVIARSKFVLCPGGAGPSSFRIFETMAAGRVPVILSDLWVPPAGPDWSACAIVIPEKNVDRLAAILEHHEERFPTMARAAIEEWQNWFAPDALFHRMTEALADIVKSRRTPEGVLCRRVTTRYLRIRARAAKRNLKNLLMPS